MTAGPLAALLRTRRPPHAPAPDPARHAAVGALLIAGVLGLTASLHDSAPIHAPINASLPLPGARIDVNSATTAQLRALPGIGPALADRIVDDREANGPYSSLTDLERVRGVGPRTIRRLADHAVANPPD